MNTEHDRLMSDEVCGDCGYSRTSCCDEADRAWVLLRDRTAECDRLRAEVNRLQAVLQDVDAKYRAALAAALEGRDAAD